MFTTNDRRRPGDNNNGLRIINDHGRSLYLVPDFAFVQEEHGRGINASDLVKVHAVRRVGP